LHQTSANFINFKKILSEKERRFFLQFWLFIRKFRPFFGWNLKTMGKKIFGKVKKIISENSGHDFHFIIRKNHYQTKAHSILTRKRFSM